MSSSFWRRPIIPLIAIAALAGAASGATWSSTAQWATYNLGKYTIYQDGWGGNYATQTLYVDTNSANAPHFWVNSNQPTGHGVQAYPNAAYTRNQRMSQTGNWTGNWNNWWGSGYYDYSFDIWVPNEVMIWTNWSSGVGPWGSYYTNATIGGTNYNVYQPGGPWSFLRTSQTGSGSCNIGAIMQWLVNNHHLSDGNVGPIGYGFEEFGGSSWYGVNSCSF